MASGLIIYIAASFRHLHGARLLGRELRRLNCEILDWTALASPPPGLTPAERRIWMDTDQNGGQVFAFCKDACLTADLIIYFGASGQDAGVEIGLAAAAGAPILGIRGPLESPGLMLHGAVTAWTEDAEAAIGAIKELARLKAGNWVEVSENSSAPGQRLARKMLVRKEKFNPR